MPRDPYADRTLPAWMAAVIATVLTIAVVGGIAIAWQQFEQDVDTAAAPTTAQDTSSDEPLSTPDPSPTESTASPTEPTSAANDGGYVPPTFAPIEADDGERPVVLLVGDGYAAGAGASSPGTSYASLLARDLGWDIRLATARGAGYTIPGGTGQTLPQLFSAAPPIDDTALVIVQGGYGGDATNEAVKSAIAALADAIQARYPDVPVVAVSSFWPGEPTKASETRERTIARAWREQEDVLLLRPQPDGWSDFTAVGGAPNDEGHEQIAQAMQAAFQSASLVSGF